VAPTHHDRRPTDGAEQAKILDIYVRGGIYAVNEARELLGLAPVPGGDQPLIYGTQGTQPLVSTSATAPQQLQRGASAKVVPNCRCSSAMGRLAAAPNGLPLIDFAVG
jgi:hypothetical protein